MALRVASRSAIAAIALVVSCIPVPAQQRAFTLEQVMSSPFPSELTAAPKGGAVAWVFNARGARNIWVAEGPDYKARQITSYNEDDGQDLGQLSWVPNGQALVYTRGGDFEWRRAAPNPRSFPQGVEQGVWLIPISGGTPRKIAEGNTAAVSPQGDRVAFLNKDQIWLAKLDGSEKAAQLVHSNGSVRDLKWAPDGSRLAFVSSRGDHSFVGVYDFGEKAVRYVDPGVDRDVEPAWSPDSRRIAFIRIPFSTKATVFGPHRAGYPWSIRIADVASGEGRQVWTASQGDGSVFYPVETDRQLH